MRNRLIWLYVLLLPISLPAQEVLSLEDAVAEALTQNLGVQVQRYNQQVAENNAHPGAANLLPSLTASGTAQYNNNSILADVTGVDPATGGTTITRQEANGIATGSAGAQAQLGYTLALSNFKNLSVLQNSASLSRSQTVQQIENTAVQVITAYYNLAKLENRAKIQRASLSKSRYQLERAQNQQEFGAVNRLAVLNAQVNVNTDSINLVSTQLTLDNARRTLSLAMGRSPKDVYSVETEVGLATTLDPDELEAQILTNNASLATADLNRQLAERNLDLAKASRYPTLSLGANYGYTYSNNGPFSFVPELQSWGFGANASLNVNLFNGFQVERQIQNAEINIASSRAQYKDTELNILRDLGEQYANYTRNWEILTLNETALEAAELNFTRTQELFELGQATSVQFREAQVNLLNVQNQLNDLRFDIKLAEWRLKQLSGQLVANEALLTDN